MIQCVFGLPRSGKSTLLSALALKAQNGKPLRVGGCRFGSGVKYDYVFTNFPVSGCYQLDFESLGIVHYENCLMLIDEVSLLCDSRNYKNFGENLKYFFALHGHYRIDCVVCSQSYLDCDVKIRRMSTDFFLVEKSFFNFSRISPINQFIGVSNNSIVESYKLGGLLSSGFLNRKKYYHLFDSYSQKPLKKIEYKKW